MTTRLRALALLALNLARRALASRWVRRVLLAVAAVVALRTVWIVGHVVRWRSHPVTSTAFMDDRADALEERAAERKQRQPVRLRHTWVDGERISPNLKRAVIAAEDARFRHHIGFDVDGLLLALQRNFSAGRVVMGGSTITQQLAKNLFLSPTRSLPRKLEEACIAILLEIAWGKERILDVYLNVIEWGDGVFGAEAAARHYYGVSASQLSPEQAAWLAAIIPSPRRHDRNRDDPDVAKKAARIRASMDLLKLP